MGGQQDGNFLAGSLPHKFIILIVTSFICMWSINLYLSPLPQTRRLMNERMNEYFIHQHTYNAVKTVTSRTVSTGQGSKSTYNCPKRYVNEETHCTKTKHLKNDTCIEFYKSTDTAA